MLLIYSNQIMGCSRIIKSKLLLVFVDYMYNVVKLFISSRSSEKTRLKHGLKSERAGHGR